MRVFALGSSVTSRHRVIHGWALVALSIGASITATSLAQTPCFEWTPGLFEWQGPISEVRDTVVFDDGSGPALYAAGSFFGEVRGSTVARWNGTSWSGLSLPAAYGFSAVALAVFDDGSGSALYAGGLGTPYSLVRWNGSIWSALGTGVGPYDQRRSVDAIAWFDDGSGPALFVGGDFATAGGVSDSFRKASASASSFARSRPSRAPTQGGSRGRTWRTTRWLR